MPEPDGLTEVVIVQVQVPSTLLMVRLNKLLAEAPVTMSVTWATKLKIPAVVGMPVMSPLESGSKPSGNPAIVHA